jgi:hypothetical protein
MWPKRRIGGKSRTEVSTDAEFVPIAEENHSFTNAGGVIGNLPRQL